MQIPSHFWVYSEAGNLDYLSFLCILVDLVVRAFINVGMVKSFPGEILSED